MVKEILQSALSPGKKGDSIRLWGIGIVCLLLFGVLILVLLWKPAVVTQPMPDFREISDIPERKAAFFDFLVPFIREADAEMLEQRDRLERVAKRLEDGRLNRRDERWIRETLEEYGVEVDPEAPVEPTHTAELLRRVDIIPASMALAQAALESGWGTSRFAQQGNNLFGIWCYTPGCGLVPKRRPQGATYEVTKYRSPKESFKDYIRNLNSNRAYEAIWELRTDLRKAERPLTGLALIDGLYRYSEEGWTYIGKVQRVIQTNNLSKYDEVY